jgi:uncharacterized protein (UPF0335 family)
MAKVKTAFAKDQLKSFISRVERLEEEKSALAADIREVYAEAKGMGFDTKIMRQVIAKRKLDRADYQEQAAMFDLYWDAVGFDSTPLGKSSPPTPKAEAPSEIPAGSHASDHGQPAPTVEATASISAHDQSDAGPEGTNRIDDAGPKPDAVASVSGPNSIAAMNAPDYKRSIVSSVDIPAFLDRRSKPPPQPIP